MKVTKHYVNEMDESMVQNCIFCGETISDYRNASWPIGQSPPQGMPAGVIYVAYGNPKIISCILSPEDEPTPCDPDDDF